MPQDKIFFATYDAVASPADATETVIAVLDGVVSRYPGRMIRFEGWVSIVPDADATGVTLKVRNDDLAGEQVGNASPLLYSSAGVVTVSPFTIVVAQEFGEIPNGTFVLTAEVADAVAGSDIGALSFEARVG